jgi:hypothetical protein
MQLQSNFTLGEITPLLYSRVDYDGYYKAAKRLRNVLVLPQGSLIRRFGTRNIGEVISIDNYTKARFIMLQYYDTDVLLIIFKPLQIIIYHNDVQVATVVSTYTDTEIEDLYFTQDSNQLWIFHEDHRPTTLQTTTPFTVWALVPQTFKNPPTYIFNANYDTITFTPSATTGSITLTASSPIFTTHFVDGLFFGNSGLMRFTGFTSTTVMTGYTLSDFTNTSGILGRDAALSEPAISDFRGWPKTGTFFQNRLVLGGTKSLPEGIFISVTGEFNNFDNGTGLDSDAINFFIRSDKANIVKHVLHTNNLIVFTSSGEWSSPPFTDKPATPKDFYLVQQARNGVTDATPVVMDDQVIFVDKGGKIVRSLIYDMQRGAYIGNNISITAPHLIVNPIGACTFENPAIYDGQFMLLVNSDGTLAVYQSMISQSVAAWSLSNTDGFFRAVTSSDSNVYFLVEREIDGHVRFFIEKLDFDYYTDATIIQNGAPTTEVTGLSQLEGKYVYATADGYLAGLHKVIGAKITIDNPAAFISVGLAYTPEIVPLPINIQTPAGHTLYNEKLVKEVYIDYYNSLGLYVNDFEIPLAPFDGIEAPLTPKSGIYPYRPMQGWEPTEEIIITQKEPLPMTIRAIGRELA